MDARRRDIAEFWRRWHISLSTWFRDYLYIPLGGSRGGTWIKIRNTFIIFIVSGFWHGANWTFIVWGALNALYFLPLLLRNKNRVNTNNVAEGKLLPSIKETLSILLTFALTVIAWIFFRAKNISHAWEYLTTIFSKSTFSIPNFPGMRNALTVIILITLFTIIEWLGREKEFAIANIENKLNKTSRRTVYYVLIIAIIYFSGKEQQFIYFQF